MEKEVLLCILFDYYGNLLTEKEKIYFQDYYFSNLSLFEISENYHISRNAIFKVIKNACEKLNFYEEKLNLYERDKKLSFLVDKIKDEKLKDQIIKLLEK